MRIAVTAAGSTLGSAVDLRFGRCPYFILVETTDLSTRAVANRNRSAGGGAGAACAQLMIDSKVEVLLTGRCGPTAQTILTVAGIEVVPVPAGTVAEAVNRFLTAGRGHGADASTNANHHR